MRRAASMMVLILAIGSGVGASFLAYRVLRDRKIVGDLGLMSEKPARSVVVASVPITYGTVLTLEHLKLVPWPA